MDWMFNTIHTTTRPRDLLSLSPAPSVVALSCAAFNKPKPRLDLLGKT